MNTAEKVITRFGGQNALARLVGRRQSTIHNWAKSGVIPARWHAQLLALAEQQGLSLSPVDLVPGSAIEGPPSPINRVPVATHWGELEIGGVRLPCYVLDTGERVFSLKGIVQGVIGTDGGQLAEYLKVKSLKPFLPLDLTPAENDEIPALRIFDTSGAGIAKHAYGLPVEKLMDLCAAYSAAFDAGDLTDRQKLIAVSANRLLRATAKVGIIALVDEVTGYQYAREEQALQLKLKLFLSEEMRPWEKTFPDELWKEFGRLTNWTGPLHSRPKYWGKLVNELVYAYLDRDVLEWLKTNVPKPRGGQSYHQWLSSQYGLKRLVEHLWTLVGMASACTSIQELRERMAERFGRQPVQLTLYVPAMIQTKRSEDSK
jgi:P63C domain